MSDDKSMSDMTDERFLGYCDIHSQTDRALFHSDQVTRLYKLANEQVPAMTKGAFYALHHWDAAPLIVKARKALGLDKPVQIVHLVRTPHTLIAELPLAIWCANERGAGNDTISSEPKNVTCPRCIEVMERWYAKLHAWAQERKQ